MLRNQVLTNMDMYLKVSITHYYSFRFTPEVELVQKIAQAGQDNYPESLHALFIVNAPIFFAGVWKVIEVFLNENTRKKVKIIGKNFTPELKKVVHEENLPSFLGGKCKCMPGEPNDGCLNSEKFTDTLFFAEFDEYQRVQQIKQFVGRVLAIS